MYEYKKNISALNHFHISYVRAPEAKNNYLINQTIDIA
jgi:hypothetical protein